jgi:c-di-GMP-binding flagellar brake protein YcgR
MSNKPTVLPSRRVTPRVEVPEGVWVYWQCHGHVDTSRVRDMSLGGLFVETAKPTPVGAPAEVDFLVQEGQIRVKTVVRHVAHGRGVGMKFAAVSERDRTNLASLISRLRTASC